MGFLKPQVQVTGSRSKVVFQAMSRSKHTRPKSILAADRVRNPRRKRGAEDRSSTRRQQRALKERGIPRKDTVPKGPQGDWSLPRIRETRPRRGALHPASKQDIARVLKAAGEEFIYGLRSIELRQGSSKRLIFGDYRPPGTIILYDQEPSPWFLSQVPSPEEAKAITSFGGIIHESQTTVSVNWPRESLRRFMLFGVLFHEIGHHQLQHHKGKRRPRIARTKDHEIYAHKFAERCHRVFEGEAL